jgi:AraC-like DNA-binding protein
MIALLNMNIIREITPLTQNDCFSIFSRIRSKCDIPLHNHNVIELNLILNASGAKRTVGNHTEEIADFELVLIGSNLAHGWTNHHCKSKEIKEVTLHFHHDLFEEKFLQRNQLANIKTMLEESKNGMLFSRQTVEQVYPRLLSLSDHNGFESMLSFLAILHELSIANDYKILSNSSLNGNSNDTASLRVEKVFNYMNSNFSTQVTLSQVSALAGMPEASFSRFIKQRTGSTFIDSLNEIRLAHVSRLLIESNKPIAEIASICGFNNLANFNRIFKSKKGCTPKEYKERATTDGSFK